MKKRELKWSLVEMGSRKPTPSARGANRLKREDVSSDDLRGKKVPSKFSLYYSFPKLSDRKPSGKNILFIPGGPGTIPTLDQSDTQNRLELLESRHNIAYFHLRASGLSEIRKSNSYDRFLRADFVVKDIEKLRIQLLKDKPWDAIWGESHGCLIAQRYAYKYGTAGVRKLVLVAPPSRSINDPHSPRRNMITSNLEAILRHYRGKSSKSATADGISEISSGENFDDDMIVNLTNNFDFLPPQSMEDIKNKLESILKDLEDRYGSINFVIDFCEELQARDRNFRKAFEYPEAFFKALRQLQFNGRPVNGLEFSERTKRLHVDAALLIAYHLMSEMNLKSRTGRPVFMTGSHYEQRLRIAQADIHDAELTSPKSLRAYWVFGVYDGISRWVLKIMNDQVEKDGFFRSQDIAKAIAKSKAGPVAQKLAKKIGIVRGEPIYPWNAGYYKHNVPTLILRGRADSVTA